MSVYFYFIFSHSNIFLVQFSICSWAILSDNWVILPNQSCKCCFGIANIKNRPVVFTSTFLGKNPLTRQTRRTFNRSRANLNGPIRNTFNVSLLKPIRDNLAGFPRALDLSPLHAQKSSGSRLVSRPLIFWFSRALAFRSFYYPWGKMGWSMVFDVMRMISTQIRWKDPCWSLSKLWAHRLDFILENICEYFPHPHLHKKYLQSYGKSVKSSKQLYVVVGCRHG